MAASADPASRARARDVAGVLTARVVEAATWVEAATARARAGRLRRAGFVLTTVVVYAIDLFLTMPPAGRRDGHHWMAFGVVDVTVGTYVLLLGALYSVLLLRRRVPIAVLAVMTAATLVLNFVSDLAQPLAGVLLALHTAAAVVGRVWLARLALLAGLVAVVGLIPVRDRGSAVLLNVGILGAVTVAVWLTGRRVQQAARDTAGLRGELAHLQEHAAAVERQRIARELHDILAHSVSAMMMQAAGARAVARGIARGAEAADPRWVAVEQALANVETTGSQSMRELQRLLGALREEAPVDRGRPSSPPGLEDLEELARVTRSSGIAVQIHRSGEPAQVDWSVGLAGYRVVQESLANAMKHAGHGAVADVFVSWRPDQLRLQVRCRPGHEGARPDSGGGGNGLPGLRQRVELIGGQFDAGWVGEEFVTTADLPLTGSVASGSTAASGERSDR